MLGGEMKHLLRHAGAKLDIHAAGIGAVRIESVCYCADCRHGVHNAEKSGFLQVHRDS
jgi:hypothetical protein